MSRAVNMGIVSLSCLVFNVSGVDRDTTSLLFRSTVDLIVCLEFSLAFFS